MGDDLSRGLLMFAEGKPLGKKGLRWLKIHLSNVFGYDKAPFDDRETFATEHLTEIYDSAENPLTVGNQFYCIGSGSDIVTPSRASNGG
jgi:DNA-directed RNA polymerase